MKNIFHILLYILIITNCLFSQTLLNNNKASGKIVNEGTIRIRSAGSIIGMPDTIGGRVEFIANRPEHQQIIPNVVYHQLFVTGETPKYVDSLWNAPGTKPLATLDSFIVSRSILKVDSVEVNAKSTVKNQQAQVVGKRDVRLNGVSSPQNIFGDGYFTNLNIDNSLGVDVVNGGGFTVTKKLELTKGELRNDQQNNFNIADSVVIIRHIGSSLASEPNMGKHITVRYVGTGSMVSTGELPSDSTKLAILRNETSDGVTLTKSVTVNKELYLKSPIITEPDTTNIHILTLTSEQDPIFDSPDAEIMGSFRRTFIRFDGNRTIFNNPYTWVSFDSPDLAGRINEMTFRVMPKTSPPYPKGEIKVQRTISIKALDINFNPVQNGFTMQMGYGWRYSSNPDKDETNNLPVADLILQRWTGSDWFDIRSSKTPQVNIDEEWGYGFASEINMVGDYAIGMPGGLLLTLNSRVLLEGPYRFGSMAMDLRMKNLIPTTPPDIYPYNLDPNRPYINVKTIPDSIVDWILLEFRPTFTSSDRYYRTVFLHVDGRIVDLDGESPVLLAKGGIDSGEYFIAVRHRNHLAIITENRVSIYPETMNQIIDFTNPSNIMGRTSALRPVGYDIDGRILWAMFTGDTNGDGKINQADFVNIWEARDMEGYLNADLNMSGLINTRDFNFGWNNRGKETLVP